MNKVLSLIFILLYIAGCNHIQTGDTLSKADLKRIGRLFQLDENEKGYKFYSEFKNSVAGNIVTDKRLASYWLDENDKSKNSISSAYYQDIQSIDTVYYAGPTYSPYMLVTGKDGSKFKVCADGEKQEIRAFFEKVLDLWKGIGNLVALHLV